MREPLNAHRLSNAWYSSFVVSFMCFSVLLVVDICAAPGRSNAAHETIWTQQMLDCHLPKSENTDSQYLRVFLYKKWPSKFPISHPAHQNSLLYFWHKYCTPKPHHFCGFGISAWLVIRCFGSSYVHMFMSVIVARYCGCRVFGLKSEFPIREPGSVTIWDLGNKAHQKMIELDLVGCSNFHCLPNAENID